MDPKVKEALEKQLQLLSERSHEAMNYDLRELAEATHAMIEIANALK